MLISIAPPPRAVPALGWPARVPFSAPPPGRLTPGAPPPLLRAAYCAARPAPRPRPGSRRRGPRLAAMASALAPRAPAPPPEGSERWRSGRRVRLRSGAESAAAAGAQVRARAVVVPDEVRRPPLCRWGRPGRRGGSGSPWGWAQRGLHWLRAWGSVSAEEGAAGLELGVWARTGVSRSAEEVTEVEVAVSWGGHWG